MSARRNYASPEDDKLIDLHHGRRLLSPSHLLSVRMKQHSLPKAEGFGTLPRNGKSHQDLISGSGPYGTLPRLTASTYTKLAAVATFADKYFTNREAAKEELNFLKAVERGDVNEVREILEANESGSDSNDEDSAVFPDPTKEISKENDSTPSNGDGNQQGVTIRDSETIVNATAEPVTTVGSTMADYRNQTCIEMEELPKKKTGKTKRGFSASRWTVMKKKHRVSKTNTVPVITTTRPTRKTRIKAKNGAGRHGDENHSHAAAKFNKNCRDEWGRSALFIAMLHQDNDILQLLLQHKVEVGECLYHAIDFGFYDVVEIFMDPTVKKKRMITDEDSFYPAGLTPIQLAAHKNDYVMLKILHANGFRIGNDSSKNAIARSTEGGSITSASSALNKTWDASNNKILYYRAMASPAYMIMMYTEESPDETPKSDFLNSIFDLYRKLKKKATNEPSARSLYIPLAEKVEEFACDLLSEVRSPADLAGILRFDPPGEPRKTSQKQYLAPMQRGFEVRMKKFVAHENCQLALSCIRQGTLFAKEGGWKTLMIRIFLAIIFPVLSIAFIIAPDSRLGKILRNPMVNLSAHMTSELAFVLMMDLRIILMSSSTCDCLGRRPDALEWLILTWIVARLVNELKKIRELPIFQNFTNIWRLNDLATTALFLGVIGLKIVDVASNSAPDCTNSTVLESVQCDRKRWGNEIWYISISEAALAGILILIHIRALEMLYIDRTLGPLQLSLDKMIQDTMRFLVLFSVTFFAFAICMTQLYWAYGTPLTRRLNATDAVCSDAGEQNCSHVYSTISNSLLEQYWTLYGYGYKGEPPAVTQVPDKHLMTPFVGSMVTVIFHLWAVVIMLNMLIAMMSHSFDRVRDNAEVEWKYHRSGMWMKYIRKGVYPRPPPMNLIPSPRDLRSLYNLAKNRILKSCCLSSHFPTREGQHMRSTTSDDYQQDYRQAISRVTSRYMRRYLLPDFKHDETDYLNGRSQSQQPRRPRHSFSNSEASSS